MLKRILFCLVFISQCKLSARIYDCFPFFNELELLAIRLEELDSVVDYFVLVEGTLTFTGKPKPLYFSENRSLFEPYLSKIIHVVVEDFPYVWEGLPLAAQPWVREEHQRNAISRGLMGAADTDLVVITDVDEIPSKEALLAAQNWIAAQGAELIVGLEMNVFRYQLNRLDVSAGLWNMGIATAKATLHHQSPDSLRMRHRIHHSIPNGGWHFTSQGGTDRVLYKFSSFSHAHDQSSLFQRQKVLTDFIELMRQYPALPIDGTWPERIRRCQAEYEAAGWIASNL